ncbi:MAG: stage II sporulation protein M [Lachnospiraceae bacterium]|nr:stage II sporulation protein M [Lachnospiraceae bacterium]
MGRKMTFGKIKIPSIVVVFLIIFLGFFSGVLTISLWQENWLLQNNIMAQDFVEMMKSLNVDKRALFFLCLWKRLRAFFVVFLLSFSSLNIISVLSYMGFCGFTIGSIVELLIIRYGFKGIVLYLAFVFPQGLFYGLAALILGCWCLNSETGMKGGRNKKVEKIRQFKEKKYLLLVVFLIFLGAYLESNINKKIFLMFFDV